MKPRRQCGIDEAGKGPVIGPMVVSIVCCDVSYLKGIGVKDSKLLSAKKRSELFNKISEKCFVKYKIISAEDINQLIYARGIAKIDEDAMAELLAYADSVTYIDCLGPEEKKTKMFRETSGKKVFCIHDADVKFPAASAASIISKVLSDAEIEKLHEKYGDFGSGYPSDLKTRDFLRTFLKEDPQPSKIVRMTWGTVYGILSNMPTRLELKRLDKNAASK